VGSDYRIKLIDIGSIVFKSQSYGRNGFTPNYCYFSVKNLIKYVES
jgi:hypothetical protein